MPDLVDRLLDMSPEEFKRWRTRRGARRPCKPRRAPRNFTKKELSEYLLRTGFRTREALREGRGKDDPSDEDYRNVFGSWTEAVKEIFNIKKVDRRYIVQSVVEFELWKRDDYRRARIARPDIFPPESVVDKEFGGWNGLKEVAAAFSLKKTLQLYMTLKERLGRKPSTEDCRKEGLILDTAFKIYGGKRGLDRFIESLEEMR